MAEKIGWFEIVKDIVIPFLGIISTLIIGIVIANILRKKEERTKKKEMLIDSYMQYLEARNISIDFEISYVRYEVLNNIIIDSNIFFKGNANSHIAYKIIRGRLDELKEEVKSLQSKSNEWSLYTFKFSFLLNKKKYLENVKVFEDRILKNLLSEDSLKTLITNLTNAIKLDQGLLEQLNSLNTYKIELAIHKIENIVSRQTNERQRKYFEPYNQKIEDLINEY